MGSLLPGAVNEGIRYLAAILATAAIRWTLNDLKRLNKSQLYAPIVAFVPIFATGMATVSYTHLDLYKRQQLGQETAGSQPSQPKESSSSASPSSQASSSQASSSESASSSQPEEPLSLIHISFRQRMKAVGGEFPPPYFFLFIYKIH